MITCCYNDFDHYSRKYREVDLFYIHNVMRLIHMLLLPALFFASCAPRAQEESGTVATAEEHHHHDHETAAIELNNGQKWKVDEGMMVHVARIEEELTGFSGSTVDDYQILASALDTNIEQLTANCTMEGRAHDELHKWLLPFIELVDHFSASTTASEAEEYYGRIKASMKDFHLYFE